MDEEVMVCALLPFAGALAVVMWLDMLGVVAL